MWIMSNSRVENSNTFELYWNRKLCISWIDPLGLARWIKAVFQVDIITFNISLSAMSRVSKWIQALTMLRLFNQTLQFNVITLSSVVTSCARVIAWLSSLNLLERTRIMSQPINEILMNSVMASMGMGEKSWRHAVSVFASASELCQVDVISYNTTMRSTNWWKSLSFMLKMTARGICDNVVSLNTLVSCLPWYRALKFLRHAEAHDAAVQADAVSYNSCINSCPRWLQVLELGRSLLLRRLDATMVTSTSTMTALEKAGMWQQLVSRIERAWDDLERSEATAVLNAGINGLGQNGEWLKSFSILQKFAVSGVLTDVITWGSLIVVCEIMERWQRALSLCSELQTYHSMEVVENSVIFNAAACAFAEGELWQQALELLHDASLSQMQVNILVYNSILFACSKAARWQESLEVLGSLNRPNEPTPSIKTYNTVLAACRCHWRQALHLFSQLPDGLEADAITFEMLVAATTGRCLQQASLLLSFAESNVQSLLKSGWSSRCVQSRLCSWQS